MCPLDATVPFVSCLSAQRASPVVPVDSKEAKPRPLVVAYSSRHLGNGRDTSRPRLRKRIGGEHGTSVPCHLCCGPRTRGALVRGYRHTPSVRFGVILLLLMRTK